MIQIIVNELHLNFLLFMCFLTFVYDGLFSYTRKEKEDWIRAKYVDKKFIYQVPSHQGASASSSKKLKRKDVVKRGTDGVLRKYKAADGKVDVSPIMSGGRFDNAKDLTTVETTSVTTDDIDDDIEAGDNDTTFISSGRTQRGKKV